MQMKMEMIKSVAFDWWDDINASSLWQNRVFYTLAGLYGFVAALALIQLIRIELRVPEYGWTTQKVFHFLNVIVNGVRCVVFVFRQSVQNIKPKVFRYVLLDMPGLLFFTTYALLVLFWAEIYYQARAISTDGLRPTFMTINAVIYLFQICIWIYFLFCSSPLIEMLSKIFFAGVSFFAALGFLLYGGRLVVASPYLGFLNLAAGIFGLMLVTADRLFLMLRRFPIESKGRRKKLQEVGYVTTICFMCFLIRCIMMFLCAFDKGANLDVMYHPILNFIYYLLVEIIPSSLVLFILRKLPPKAWSSSISSHSLAWNPFVRMVKP